MGTALLLNTPTDMLKLGVTLRSFANESKSFKVSKTHTKAICHVACPFKRMFITES